MACIRFKDLNLRAAKLAKIDQANEIIEEYLDAGYRMTLRQLYYQFVARDMLSNTEKSYKNLAKTISDGRLAGLVDWDAIEDRGRVPEIPSEWDSIEEIVDASVRQFRLPRRATQDTYVELWVEKQALAGVLEPLAHEAHITLMVNKGYSSQSAMYESACRFINQGQDDKLLFYLGDMDPSGEDMVRDIDDRMHMFGVDLEVRKLALTMDQVEQYNPPPNPAKITDPRAYAYIARHGTSSWEVDALPPDVLESLIRGALGEVTDAAALKEEIKREDQQRDLVSAAINDLDLGELIN